MWKINALEGATNGYVGRYLRLSAPKAGAFLGRQPGRRGNGDLLGLNFTNQQRHLYPRRRAGLDGVRSQTVVWQVLREGEEKIVRINLQHNLDYLV